MTDNKKRIAIQVTPEMLAVPAFRRFVDKYDSTEGYASRRSQLINVLQAGALMTEADLQHAFMFLDTEAFSMASVQDRQRMILNALSLRLGMSTIQQQAAPLNPPAQTVAQEESQAIQQAPSPEPTPLPDYDTQPADREPTPSKAKSVIANKFSGFNGA